MPSCKRLLNVSLCSTIARLPFLIWLQVVDGRSSARFKGEVPEPRPSLLTSNLLDADLGTSKTKAELAVMQSKWHILCILAVYKPTACKESKHMNSIHYITVIHVL